MYHVIKHSTGIQNLFLIAKKRNILQSLNYSLNLDPVKQFLLNICHCSFVIVLCFSYLYANFTFPDSGFLILTDRIFVALLLISLEFGGGKLKQFHFSRFNKVSCFISFRNKIKSKETILNILKM